LILVGVSSIATFPSWWLQYVFIYTLFSRTIYNSYLLPTIFFFVLCTSNSYYEIIVFTFVSVISTSVVFIDWIVLNKLSVRIENNYSFVVKVISSFSSMIPF
jgi:hypothetical protein